MKLYPEQQAVVDKIITKLNQLHFQLLTGEVGVGKTYMGASIVKYWLENETNNVLIICPSQVRSKWSEVLASCNINLDNVQIVTKFNDLTINEHTHIIYDEIHLMKTRNRYFKKFNNRQGVKLVGLTGSIIDQDPNDLIKITQTFNKDEFGRNLFWPAKEPYMYGSTYIRILVEPLLTEGLSKDSVKAFANDNDKGDKTIINTHKISITMNDDESRFYKFLITRLASLNITPKSQLNILNEFLDRDPKASSFVTKRSKKDGEWKTNQYFIGEKLHGSDTKKLDALLSCLKKNKLQEKTLVYTLSDHMAKFVADQTGLAFISSKSPTAVDDINKTLKSSTVVVNILPILEGVDLNANNIIWYQTPLTLSQEVQGVGRICRLSSERTEKNVFYLYHENTMQKQQVEKIEDNHKLNNELIKKQDQTPGKVKYEVPTHIPLYHLTQYE